jgi:hypothetical protein
MCGASKPQINPTTDQLPYYEPEYCTTRHGSTVETLTKDAFAKLTSCRYRGAAVLLAAAQRWSADMVRSASRNQLQRLPKAAILAFGKAQKEPAEAGKREEPQEDEQLDNSQLNVQTEGTSSRSRSEALLHACGCVGVGITRRS